jgi:hypothetical protein
MVREAATGVAKKSFSLVARVLKGDTRARGKTTGRLWAAQIIRLARESRSRWPVAGRGLFMDEGDGLSRQTREFEPCSAVSSAPP